MLNLIMMGGTYMLPMMLFAIIIFVLAIKKVIDLFFKKNLTTLQLEKGINAILFWGAISALLGFLGHYHGLYEAMKAISQAHDISPAIVSMGYAISLITILSGLWIFFVSAVLWFFFRWRVKSKISITE